MSLPRVLVKVLNDDGEPLKKRLKIAEHAFKAPEFQLYHKEALLLKWILNNSEQFENEGYWLLVNRWLSSKEFKNLTQNDITNEDIFSIIELFQNKLLKEKRSILENQQIVHSVSSLCDSTAFQQYFKYNTKLYCKLVSLCLKSVELPLEYIDFISKSVLFPKAGEQFSKHFVDILYPVLVEKASQFKDNLQIQDETVRIIQKCLFHGNINNFQTFLNQQFETSDDKANDTVLSKSVFKYLASTLQNSLDSSVAAQCFELFFRAFCDSFKEPDWIFKCLIYLTHLLKFDTSRDFTTMSHSKRKPAIRLTTCLSALVRILRVISARNVRDCTVANVSLIVFLRNILKSLVSLNLHDFNVYEIILICIVINPLIIEPLACEIIVFVIRGNNVKIKEMYEKVAVAIFEVFAKLHRFENFIAKIIPASKIVFMEQNQHSAQDCVIYGFNGEQDIQVLPKNEFCAQHLFTNIILQCFTSCLAGLASWQAINVFKTMLYHFKNAVEEYASNVRDSEELTFLEILGILTTHLLKCVKIADHTISQNVLLKFRIGLEDLRDILKKFGPAILKKQHNHIAMRTFLNLSYVWAEVYVTLTYYSMDNEVKIATVMDKTYSAANLKYLHSYMDIKEWQLIGQRITNFGEPACKMLLQKLYIQKLRAMLLLEKDLKDDVVNNVVKTIQSNLDDTWQDILLDKFTVNFLLPKMNKASLIFLTENLMEFPDLYEKNHIGDSVMLINSTVYVVMSKINKLFKVKRKHDAEQQKNFSWQAFALFPQEIFFSQENYDLSEVFERIMDLFERWDNIPSSSITSKEEKLRNYLSVLKRLPFIYSNLNIQKIVLVYLFSLSIDILKCSEEVRRELETLIIGALQACKFPLTDIFSSEFLTHFHQHEVLFSLVIDNVFKHEKSIANVEPLIAYLVKNLDNSKLLNYSILVLQVINKMKKSKMGHSTKEKANQYKEKILMKLSKFVCKSNCHIEAYATCLKHYLSVEKDMETLNTLLDKLESYIEYSLDNISEKNDKGSVILFTTILQNKTKIKSLESDIVLKIWNACKKINISDSYSHLVKLIVTLIPNEEFESLIMDLFSITEKSIQDRNYSQLVRQLKTWGSILTCDVNPIKMKIWQEILEKLTYELLHVLRNTDYNEDLYKSIVHLEQGVIQAQHFILSPPLTDMFIMSVSFLMRHENDHFESLFGLSISTLEALLKYRHAIIMDRLPAFLQQYRVLLKAITNQSNSEDINEQKIDSKAASECVHKLEKLTKNLVACKKDMSRIAVFLIADILERYEQINLYPNVKLHLNNCIYSLISLCDHHAVSYLMRALSSASTEMFKISYNHYKKYYMFTGKV